MGAGGLAVLGTGGEHVPEDALADDAVRRLEDWLRGEFVDLNTTLEQAYFAARSEVLDDVDLVPAKLAIARDGARLVAAIGEPFAQHADAAARYRLLGAVGFYLAAYRRHDIERVEPATDELLAPVWSLALRLGGSLGVAPRYVFAHQSIHSHVADGVYRTFTALPDEQIFVTNNALAVDAYQRAAAVLRQIPAMGVSSPVAGDLLEQARAHLDDVLRFDRVLSDSLDVDRFFSTIRPYFKPYRVGDTVYRGANAGDFAAINEIDLLLGLCSVSDPFYQRILTEKLPYVPPEDQPLLRGAISTPSLLDLFLTETAGTISEPLRQNAKLFLSVCRAHGAVAVFHHHKLVKPFLEVPAKAAPPQGREELTASGPPLEVVMAGLERLTDLRAARERPGVPTARSSLTKLEKTVGLR